jgi:hypothetical protein
MSYPVFVPDVARLGAWLTLAKPAGNYLKIFCRCYLMKTKTMNSQKKIS